MTPDTSSKVAVLFPVRLTWKQRRHFPGCPGTIPSEVIAPFEAQAWRNHDQSLQMLADRGGLHPVEAWAVMTGKDWIGYKNPCTMQEAVSFLKALASPSDDQKERGR
jgi:hypothetical protein